MVGTRVAVGAVEHQYFVTEKSGGFPPACPRCATPMAISTSSPSRADWRSAGGRSTPGLGTAGIPVDFGPELLQPDYDRFEPLGSAACARIPVLNEVGIRQMINGPIPITADGEPVIGLSPELDNFYLCCGFTSGIAASGGAGWVWPTGSSTAIPAWTCGRSTCAASARRTP